MSRHLPMLFVLAGLALASMLAAGCGSTSDKALHDSLTALDTRAPTIQSSSKSIAPEPKCGDATRSLRPTGSLAVPGKMPAGSSMRRIQERGRLIAGVDQNTLLFGYLDSFTGRFQGFEIDLLHQIAKAIFGDPNRIEFKALTTAQRLPYVQDGSVDIVADAVTINCKRLEDVWFSSVYFEAGQRVLVPVSSSARGIQDLGGKRVCATEGSTSLENLQKEPSHPVPYPVPQRTDCLVALQEGKVAAIRSDDAILLGFKAQDPYTKLVGPRLTAEPYGMAISKSHPEFVRFVNAVLARMRADGTLAALYRKWLGAASPAVPPAHYRD